MSAAPTHPSGAATSPAEERDLLQRLRAGDRAAFSTLVTRHGGALLRLATAFVKDRAVAEEVVQDAWLAALEHLDGFEGRSALRTWLFQVVANRARTRLARDGRTVPFSALEGPPQEGAGESAVDPDRFDAAGHWRTPPAQWSVEDPERLAQAAETRGLLERAIADLPEAMRAVIVLRDVEGLETEEICNLLGVTVSNQRVLLHRARARVRQALELHLAGAR
jgi:RNA polymerase sigma-70 factor (ECF subfamily)